LIRRIEALRYRCLESVAQEIRPFHLLVGANGTGKSTFLDVPQFLGDLVAGGLDAAISNRSENLQDLIWRRSLQGFELAIELEIPEDTIDKIGGSYRRCRYEVAVGVAGDTDENVIKAEKVLLCEDRAPETAELDLFPRHPKPPETILSRSRTRGVKTVVNKSEGGNDNFYTETGKGWVNAFKLGPHRSALGNLPEDETKFPVATWLKRTLVDGMERLVLNSAAMKRASAPGQPRGFRPDGSNVPWAVKELRRRDSDRIGSWINHIRTAIPEIEDIETVERKEDRHRYLQVVYRNGLKAPSWIVSDGTLRLLALTLVAYLRDPGRIWLVEEPENGIHPRAVETVYQAFRSTYDSQILCATHSPVVLSLADPKEILCFGTTSEGATDVIEGNRHPNLRDWRKEADLGTLFAAGVLG